MHRPPAHLLRLVRLSDSVHPRARALRATCTLALAAALFAGGCGGDAGIDASASDEDAGTERLDAPGLDAGALEDAASSGSTRTTIGPAGGTARSADGLFEIIVAAGALTEDVELVITPVPSAEVPADVAATEPISEVYSVEPDGLTFGGDGAYVRFRWDGAPSALVDDTGPSRAYGAAFALARPASGGTLEAQAEPRTLHDADGSVELVARLAHLSLHWSVHRLAESGEEHWMGTDFGAAAHDVGSRWLQTVFVRSSRPQDSVRVALSTGSVGIILPGNGETLSPELQAEYGDGEFSVETVLPQLPGDPPRSVVASSERRPPAGFPAGTEHLLRPYGSWTCQAVGTELLAVEASFATSLLFRARVTRREPSACVEPVVAVSILDTIPAIRDNLAILTDTAPLPEVRVETRREGTRTVSLGGGTWSATLEPARGAVAAGPATITAENAGGATMTATRDASTGEYTALIDDPSLWDPDVSTQVAFGATPRSEIRTVPQFGTAFGPVAGLDTSMTLEADTRLAIRIPGELRCGVEDVLDPTVFRDIVDTFPLEGPLREGLQFLADHCGVAIETLTGRPFTVELSRRRSALEIMPDYTARVDVGRAITLSGEDLLRECGGRFSMFCRDRCVDPTGDPMNCGACGRVGVEVCNDMADNDCNYYVDDGCPNRIDWGGGGDADTSAMIGDVVSASDGPLGHGCPYNQPFIGLCGNANSDGTVRGFTAICGLVRLVPTGPDAFDVEVTESYPGGVACEMGSLPLGGTLVGARCPRNMVADGVFGAAPSSGNLGQVGVSCSQWDVVRDPALGWVIRRISSGVSPTIGSGPGMPFPAYMVSDHSTLGTPGALRQLRGRHRIVAPAMMPGGVLWFSAAGSPPFLALR